MGKYTLNMMDSVKHVIKLVNIKLVKVVIMLQEEPHQMDMISVLNVYYQHQTQIQ